MPSRPWWGRKRAAADFEAQEAEFELRVERQTVAVGVALAFEGLLLARRRVLLLEEAQSLLEGEVEAVKELIAAGLLPAIDRQRAATESLAGAAELADAQHEARLLEVEFAFALGFERPVELELDDSSPLMELADTPDLESLLVSAAAARPELRAAEARYRARLERLHLEASGLRYLPQIGLGQKTESGDPTLFASLAVELPVFDTARESFAKGNAELKEAAAGVRAAAHEVSRDVCTAEAEVRLLQDQLVSIRRPLLQQREQLAEQARLLFEAGELEYLDYLSSRRAAVQSKLDVCDLEGRSAAARVRLQAALGDFSKYPSE
ncbi:MAG: TolC family protein [Planctomycetota bacterium]